METLYEKLSNYHSLEIYPMHMPGHKRNASLLSGRGEEQVAAGLGATCQMDITEIDGFDNLGAPKGILKESMERAARLYHADETQFLINGSTVGLLAGIMGSTNKGDTVLVARNCHKAVYNALYLNELKPVYLYPQINSELGFYEEISVELVQKQLKEHPEISLVVITSPTYEGVVSDIPAIAEVVHAHGAMLLVDEAHGAHFGFHPYFPISALSLGADIVIQSLHKTMPAFTQTALLHMNGNKVNKERIRQFLTMLQSSSPSYVLMAGIDHCIQLMEQRGNQLFDTYVENLQALYQTLSGLKHLSLYELPKREGVTRDPSKLVISTAGTSITAGKLYERLLHEHHIQLEMASKDYGIAMTSIGDTLEGFHRLSKALFHIDEEIQNSQSDAITRPKLYELRPKIAIPSIYEAKNSTLENIPLSEAEGRICGGYVYQYPPGIPVLTPGEVITKEHFEVLTLYDGEGYQLVGLEHNQAEEKTIQVLTR